MMEQEDKGFIVKDRRKVGLESEQPEEQSAEQAPQTTQEAEPSIDATPNAAGSSQSQNSSPLPQVTFATFVFSLSSSALVHLGEIPDPVSHQTQQDLVIAKQIIDTLGMLDEKTRGNLDPNEQQLLENMLYDLRMHFVQKSA